MPKRTLRKMRVKVTIIGTVEFDGTEEDALEHVLQSPFGVSWFGKESSGAWKPDEDHRGKVKVRVEKEEDDER